MKTEDLAARNGIKPLKFAFSETPHATIETNRTCNMRCQSCYNLDKEHVKSLDLVIREVDLIAGMRKLHVISLMGGEPTLHPELPEIVAYIKKKGLLCQLLTNGIVFLQEENDVLLDKLIDAGLDKILLHVDSGQRHYHKDIEEARERLFSKFEEKKICFSLSVTVYNDSTRMLSKYAKRYAKYRYFDGILAVLARDSFPPHTQNAEMVDEYEALSCDLQIEPITYIPSGLDDDTINWLAYFYFIHADTGETFGISPLLDRAFRRLYKMVKGHHHFAVKMNRSLVFAVFISSGLLEIMLHPKKSRAFFRLLIRTFKKKAVRFHYMAIQDPPVFDEEKNEIHLCHGCPDATIRNGKITPVCIADKVRPFAGKGDPHFQKEIYREACIYFAEV